MNNKTPQAGIFNENERHMHFLEYVLTSDNIVLIKQAISKALEIEQSEQLTLVVSFGKQAWQKLQSNWTPATLEDFTEIKGKQGHIAAATQADVFFWLQGEDIGDVFDAAMHIHHAMKQIANLTLEQQGFDYHHKKDLIGFEDGTANPKTDELKRAAAVIPKGQPGEGGSLVLSEKWVHDMDKWGEVPVHCQEAIVGRTKIENEELQGDAMPPDSHVSRTDLKVDGVAMKIYRRSAPYGTVQENGLMFLAFACELKRFTSQLESMYGLADDGMIDQLLNYSKAVSGSYWFAPAVEDLQTMLK
ncbi:deferrochelatase/peroxidase YfeX [Thiomicrorhabdus immobilis]|uniref:Deferrochelatase/peroxidase YfeX n=1 Tax=Thiomicrorhabdus immobilis TaxID=2791037 RepID=A0ABM7MBW8_9GAMM|nr:Dyp-type peroxidase [Thiomicrorhabdus immobilis]BCN92864.1 deferrochelatase/peroxidase YfeX [Thiomicrorhabdus immobilis]